MPSSRVLNEIAREHEGQAGTLHERFFAGLSVPEKSDFPLLFTVKKWRKSAIF
jgi:hypothetical protein